jgi:hypothetical protein
MSLRRTGENGNGETFWKLDIPEEFVPGGLEVGVRLHDEGIQIAGETITWVEIEAARAKLTS